MNWLHLLAGPLVGAVIGYCTNYIAVKMLFRPRRAVKLGKWQLPLTPGIIPKRKPQLAHAIGQAVGGQLFTETDVKEALLSAEVRETVADSVLDGLAGSSRSLEELCQRGMGEAAYDRCKEAISQKLCEKLETEVRRMDLGSVIAAQGAAAIKEKVSGTMLAMFVHDRSITGMAESIRSGVDRYLEENLHEALLPKVQAELDLLAGKSPEDLCQGISADPELLRKVVDRAYGAVVTSKADQVLGAIHVSDIVEQKINGMNVEEIERLVLSVMKNELRMIVNLGALIGFVLGIINVFVG